MKSIVTFCFMSFTMLIYGQSIEELNLIANEQLKKYLSANTWEERLPCVLHPDETSKFMEKRYSANGPFTPNDTSSFIYKIYQNIITKPLIKETKLKDYYKKSYSFNFQGKLRTGTYPFKLVDGNLLIDWMVSTETSELTLKSFDLRKPKDYVFMRVQMVLVEHKYEKELPDYFTVRIQQNDEGVSEYALIHKDNPNSQILLEELYDGNTHQKVIWIKPVGMASKDPSSYYQLLENIRLIGFVNSVVNDSYYVDEENGVAKKINVESPNLLEEQKQFQLKKDNILEKEKQEKLLKEQKERERKEKEYFDNIILSQPISLKQLNASRIEYYSKTLELSGYLVLSDYYNYGYGKSEATHYSFRLKDPNGDDIQIYFLKEKCKPFFERLSKTSKIPVKVKVIAYLNLQEQNIGNLLMEGISIEELQIKN